MVQQSQVLRSRTRDSWLRRVIPRPIRTTARGLIVGYLNRRAVEPYWIDVDQRGAHIKFLIANAEGQAWYGPYVSVENREMTFLQERVLRPGMSVVEVGAHQGFTAALIATWIGPEGRVRTFEPLQRNCDVAKLVIEANELTNVELTRAAVGDESGSIYIGTTTTNPNVQKSGFLGEPTPLVRLDDAIAGPIDLLKIDVEGYELHVLRGAKRLLEARPHLQIEVHPGPIADFGGTVQALFDLIDVGAYDFWLQEGGTTNEPHCFAAGDPIKANVHLYAIRKVA